ncbi:hypothetical protein HD553DRAFT_342108 [Filobasidium floriforme]|uniref:uncharacterized protein n=1 Tax=Filobasidium floriforme TaxID=5210 RepID=UPI001E8E8A1D|nr:uncharacterized protein HD553DRAFT_342108 [Filobasidium floriforme]KAH8084618.1 hypothetical protein HD553DRAFT_342108 [Filobasidium floriforme]
MSRQSVPEIPLHCYWDWALPQNSWDGLQDTVFTSETLQLMIGGKMMPTSFVNAAIKLLILTTLDSSETAAVRSMDSQIYRLSSVDRHVVLDGVDLLLVPWIHKQHFTLMLAQFDTKPQLDDNTLLACRCYHIDSLPRARKSRIDRPLDQFVELLQASRPTCACAFALKRHALGLMFDSQGGREETIAGIAAATRTRDIWKESIMSISARPQTRQLLELNSSSTAYKSSSRPVHVDRGTNRMPIDVPDDGNEMDPHWVRGVEQDGDQANTFETDEAGNDRAAREAETGLGDGDEQDRDSTKERRPSTWPDNEDGHEIGQGEQPARREVNRSSERDQRMHEGMLDRRPSKRNRTGSHRRPSKRNRTGSHHTGSDNVVSGKHDMDERWPGEIDDGPPLAPPGSYSIVPFERCFQCPEVTGLTRLVAAQTNRQRLWMNHLIRAGDAYWLCTDHICHHRINTPRACRDRGSRIPPGQLKRPRGTLIPTKHGRPKCWKHHQQDETDREKHQHRGGSLSREPVIDPSTNAGSDDKPEPEPDISHQATTDLTNHHIKADVVTTSTDSLPDEWEVTDVETITIITRTNRRTGEKRQIQVKHTHSFPPEAVGHG